MTAYITIIRAILKSNGIEADAKVVLAEMQRCTAGAVDDLPVLAFIDVCLKAEKAVRP